MELTTIWFLLVGILLIGYFILDGFDFGVGIALPFVSRDDTDRRVVINTIGPVWDLNETWVIVAGACLFAAFPEWYATMFSGFYLALLLILIALILRGVSFEYRHQVQAKNKVWFDRFIFWGSLLPPLLWGTAFANLIYGLPLTKETNGGWIFEGTLLTLLNPYSLLGGLTVLLLCFTHGLVYLALKSAEGVRERSQQLAVKVGAVTILVAAAFIVWTIVHHLENANLPLIIACAAIAALSLIAAWVCNFKKREGLAFTFTAITIAFALLMIFAALFPNLMIAADPSQSMTIVGAASSEKTLVLMTWVAVFTLPFVLAYQAWTFWTFRKRITRDAVTTAAH